MRIWLLSGLIAHLLLLGCQRAARESETHSRPVAPAAVKPAPPLVEGPYKFGLEAIKSLRMTRGPEEWTEEIPIRLQGAMWTFGKNGQFEFAPTMSREALYPVKGTFRVTGSQYHFEAGRETSADPAGHARVEVWGTVEFADAPLLTMRVRETHGSGRVDPKDPISKINQTEYEAVITLKRR